MSNRRQFLMGGGALWLAAGAATVSTSGSALAAAPDAAAVAQAVKDRKLRFFDAHTHVISPDFERYPLNIPPPIPGVPPNPAIANLPDRIRANPTNIERVLQLWDRFGVEGGVGVQYRTSYGTNNTYLLDSSAAHPARLVPIVLLDPYDPNTQYALRSLMRDRGAAGVRFSAAADPATGRYLWLDGPAALGTWQAADDLGGVIVLMPVPANTPDPKFLELIARQARQYPHARIVLDHFGWVPARGAPDHGLTPAHAALKVVPNVYFKLSSIVLEQQMEAKLSTADFVRHAVDTFGANRILWGSDLGNTTAPYEEMIEMAIDATRSLTDAERRAVLHDTAKRVHVRGGTRRR